jgi:RNA polymerase sigma factor (TIGR02999 family)
MAVAAVAMRQILVDHSRRRNADKRGGGRERAEISISDVEAPGGEMQDFDVLRIDALLTELTALGPRRAQIAEMRLFGGMSIDQIAGVLGCSRMTAHRDWQTSRAWLAARCQDPPRA